MFDLGRLFEVLCSHRVEFFVVGGVAAALQGAPVLTQDVDILYLIEEANLLRLKRALDELNAVARGDPRMLRFDETHLRTAGHKLASTDAGPLDVLGSINEGLSYQDLLGSTEELEVMGHAIRVLSLERLIELKRALARPKDLAMLPVLEATLRERTNR
ncbi:MAG TPA: nucleotidyltransferase [Polyangiaceae bacterium]|nr:nucleotidyltransferase [Polyangiaceae bacterium]